MERRGFIRERSQEPRCHDDDDPGATIPAQPSRDHQTCHDRAWQSRAVVHNMFVLEENMTSSTSKFNAFSDKQLLVELKRLANVERHATAELLRCLIEVDHRRLYLHEGCSSLFTYCTQVIRLSESAAYNRIEVARTARRLPALLDAIADGTITLTSARLLAPHLTLDNHQRAAERGEPQEQARG